MSKTFTFLIESENIASIKEIIIEEKTKDEFRYSNLTDKQKDIINSVENIKAIAEEMKRMQENIKELESKLEKEKTKVETLKQENEKLKDESLDKFMER